MSERRKRREAQRKAQKLAKQRERAVARRDAEGRTHLVVQRDLAGRPVGLALSRPLFEHAWQNEVAAGAASTAHGLLSAGLNARNAAELGRRAMAGTSKIADGVVAQSKEHALACRAGCAHCCYQSVGVSAPEAFAIHEHLRAKLSPPERDRLVARIHAADDRTRGVSSAERLSPELPCPFLESERCSIYEVRPLACRGANSLDASACERTLRDPEARAQFLSGSLSVPCFLEPIRAFHAVAAGVQLALDELHGLKAAPLELTAAMRILLDAPEDVPARWLAGEDPFRAAVGGETAANPKLRDSVIGRS